MSFDSEKQLKKFVIKRVNKDFKIIFTKNGLKSYQEVPYAAGVTDLVVYNISNKYYFKRMNELKLKEGIVKDSYLKIYLLLKRKDSWTINDLVRELKLSKPSVLKIINWLNKNGFIERKKEFIKISRNFRRHVTNSCAFELKLCNWKEALKQAFGAKSFSNTQFVILDDDYAKPALENKFLFHKYNIGLASVLPDSRIKKHYIPYKDIPYSDFGVWKFNELSFSSLKK
ncbi:MAG: hypothetical protein ACFE9R_02255 [Candidatus Hermodarchaeota archaeon]